MKKEQLVQFWCDRDFFEMLEDARWEARLSRSEYIRAAIREKAKEREGGGG